MFAGLGHITLLFLVNNFIGCFFGCVFGYFIVNDRSVFLFIHIIEFSLPL